MSFGLALSVGHESDAEYLDVELADTVDPDRLPSSLSAALPEGIDVTGVAALPNVRPLSKRRSPRSPTGSKRWAPPTTRSPSPRSRRWSTTRWPACRWRSTRTRKGREVVEDIRPTLRRLTVCGRDAAGVLLDLEVSTQPRGTRPVEVLHAIGKGQLVEWRVLRTHQWIERDGARLEPLEADTRSSALIGSDERALHDVRAS